MIRWKLWAAGVLGVALAAALWAWREEIETRVRYAVEGEQLTAALEAAQNEAARQRELRKMADDIAEERSKRLEALRQREQDFEDDLRALEAENEELRRWNRGRLPDVVVDRLLGEGADREDGAGAADSAD